MLTTAHINPRPKSLLYWGRSSQQIRRERVRHFVMKAIITLPLSYLVAQSVPNFTPLDPIIEKGGMTALVGIMLWWILASFNKRIEALGVSIDRQSASFDRLADVIHDRFSHREGDRKL